MHDEIERYAVSTSPTDTSGLMVYHGVGHRVADELVILPAVKGGLVLVWDGGNGDDLAYAYVGSDNEWVTDDEDRRAHLCQLLNMADEDSDEALLSAAFGDLRA